jgi:hypothetical protein
MKKAMLLCVASLICIFAVMNLLEGWFISWGIRRPTIGMLNFHIWGLIGWIAFILSTRKLQLIRYFLKEGPLDVLEKKALELEGLYTQETLHVTCLRSRSTRVDKDKKVLLLSDLRRVQKAISKAKPEFWRAAKFAADNGLIRRMPESYQEVLPKRGLEG